MALARCVLQLIRGPEMNNYLPYSAGQAETHFPCLPHLLRRHAAMPPRSLGSLRRYCRPVTAMIVDQHIYLVM